MREIRNLCQHCAQLSFIFGRVLLVLLALLAQLLGFFNQCARIATCLLQLRDLFRRPIASRLQIL